MKIIIEGSEEEVKQFALRLIGKETRLRQLESFYKKTKPRGFELPEEPSQEQVYKACWNQQTQTDSNVKTEGGEDI